MCQAWKWFIILFETALMLEVIITGFFWLMLWPILKNKPLVKNATPLLYFEIVITHILPFAALLIDFLLHTTPIPMRHLVLAISTGVVYVMVNMIIVLSTGNLIYPMFTWTDTKSYTLLVILIAIAVMVYSLMSWVSMARLARGS